MKKTERNIAATFARNLKFFRQKCNYSQEKLAELIDVSPATISNYETGEMWPSRQNLASSKSSSLSAFYRFFQRS